MDDSLRTVVILLHIYFTDWFCGGLIFRNIENYEGSLFSKLEWLTCSFLFSMVEVMRCYVTQWSATSLVAWMCSHPPPPGKLAAQLKLACVAGVWKGRELKGVLGARETRGAREEGGREFPPSFLPRTPLAFLLHLNSLSLPFQTPATQPKLKSPFGDSCFLWAWPK